MTTPSSDSAGRSGGDVAPAEAHAYRVTIYAIAAMVCAILICETLYGLSIGSRFLIRDGLEWIYDVLIYAFSAVAFARGARAERAGALACAATLAAAGVETVVQIAWTWADPPEIETFGITVSGALTSAEAVLVAVVLWRFRGARNPVIEASWLSARNDVLSSTLSALVTMAARFMPWTWPQMAVDVFGAFLCFQAAWVVSRDALAPTAASPGVGGVR